MLDTSKANSAASGATEVKQPAKRKLRWRSQDIAPYLFISPFFIIFLIFGFFPIVFSIYLSFHYWDPSTGLNGMEWIGFENFEFVLTDEWFHKSIWNTIWIALASGIPQHLIAIPLAFFLQTAFSRWRNAVTGLYFLPFITSSVAIALVFTSLFSRDYGVVNLMLTSIGNWSIGGWQPLAWLFPTENIDWTKPEYTKPMISFIVFWRYLGWNVILYLSAMQVIPKSLYEAAEIDGAKPWQKFWYVTVPLLKPMVFFAVTLTIIGNLQLFEEPFIVTGGTGGLAQSGKTAALHMYITAFVESDFGTASAIAWLLFVFMASMTWLNNKLLGNKEP